MKEERKMDTFKKPEISDKGWVSEVLNSYYAPSMEYCFSTIFLWADFYKTQIRKLNNCLLVRFGEDKSTYLFPAGENPKDAIDWILKNSKNPVCFAGIVDEQKEFLEENYKDRFSYTLKRDSGDYIYTVEQLSTLKGKKLSSKRNHINRFLENNPDWSYEEITEENIKEVDRMHDEWTKIADDKESRGLYEEGLVVKKALKYFKELELFGGLLRANDKVVAFSLGNKLNSDTIIVHIEKAFYDIQGAYPMINKQFVLANAKDFKFVNREEDTGDEGLRKAKLSYSPYEILNKYNAKEITK